ncbi:MAG: hypothetical protein FWC16_13000 [Defluviitaleaceae bacterium]|nr:hypothetical protein [Defluviitaleaceae bacterium]MCL2275838.1 hypothetical protein [Defluviitaleaceae bacterium]
MDAHEKAWGEFLLTAFAKFIVAILQRLGIIKTGRGANRDLHEAQPLSAWLHDLTFFVVRAAYPCSTSGFFLCASLPQF